MCFEFLSPFKVFLYSPLYYLFQISVTLKKNKKPSSPKISILIYAVKYINYQLKFRTNKNYYQKRTAHWHIKTFVWLRLLRLNLIDVTSFRL